MPSGDPTPPAVSRTVVVVLATTPAAALRRADGTLLDRLIDQLSTFSTGDVHVIARSSGVIHAPGGAYMIGSEGSHGLAEDLRRVAGVARTATGPVAVVAGNLVVHTEALALLMRRPDAGTAALVAKGGEEPGPSRPPVRIDRGLVVAAGTAFHDVAEPNGTFRGAFQVGADDLLTLAATAETLADLAEVGRFGPADGAETGELLLAGLLRSGVTVRAVRLGRLRCDRVTIQAEADEAVSRLGEVDESRARLDAVVKTDDGFFATYFVSSWSKHVVRLAAMLGLTPNAVTGISVGLAVLAAVWFSDGTRSAQVAGAVLLYLSFVLDCVDGQLARYTRAFSPLGAWLDATFDRVKEYVVYVGLAFGYAAGLDDSGGGPDGIWALAVAAMILQMLRHMIDFSYAGARADTERARRARAGDVGSPAALDDMAAGPSPRRRAVPTGRRGRDPYAPTSVHAVLGGGSDGAPGTGPDVAAAAAPGAGLADEPVGGPADETGRRTKSGNWVVRLSRRLEEDSFTRWLKKIIVLPIGERMALIAVTAALFNARVTFVALLTWGCVAALYTLAGRIARSAGRRS
ncbi:CDP-alcohol phosphatidyltransferase family protein [Streptosporangium carneum]|uniref:CDP-alcohol phosphatidyltransferase family protein n=1 Tax=Streptosporangium carneum TaxID=47481 RepID=UPI0022F2CE1C|nr:CDP-alcohol phosphatidyltransferase family protein [Streptosporangium carneum]